MKPIISLITLAVADVSRARRFYESLGWKASADSQDGCAFFQAGTTVLALYGRDALARDTGQPAMAGGGSPGMTLAQNCQDPEAVDNLLARMVAAGATLVKAGHAAPWGGYFGFVADPDGHVWEIAHNPFWPLADDGTVTLPPPV